MPPLSPCSSSDLLDIAMAIELRQVLNNAFGYDLDWCFFVHLGLSVRYPLQEYPSIPFLLLNLTGLLHDGRRFGQGQHCSCDGRSGIRYHGTSDLPGLLSSNGVLLPATRTSRGKQGWYSFPADGASSSFRRALQYSRPHPLGRCMCRVVLKVAAECYNTVPGTDWHYTKTACRRYSIIEAYVVSADSTAFLGVF